MRSTEESGVGVNGFGVPISAGRKPGRAPAKRSGRTTFQLTPLTSSLASLILLAALFSIWVDFTQTLAVTQARQHLAMQVRAAQPMVGRLGKDAVTLLLGETDLAAAFVGVAVRGSGTLALAFGCIALFGRRVRRDGLRSRQEIESYRDLIATIPFGVACWTPAGKLIVCNEQFMARLGVGAGQMHAGVSYKVSIARLAEGGYIRMMSEDEASRSLELRREDGSCLLIDERPLSGGGFVTLVTDVTERRRADHLLESIQEEQRVLARRYHEEKLRAEAASRSKTSFLAHLSHDIRTPLNHIIGFAELMRHETYGPLGDQRYQSYVETIKGSGERLLSFFAAILDLAELESGRKQLKQESFDIDNLMLAVARRFSIQAQRAQLTLSLGTRCEALLLGDRVSLERMIGNLVDNAVRFTPAGGAITIAAHAAADGVVVEVTDTGVGMTPERLDTLSQPFAFGDAALTREHDGAGLGLAIARAIAESSGGRLAIDSRPGLGTTVAVSLPRHVEQQARAA